MGYKPKRQRLAVFAEECIARFMRDREILEPFGEIWQNDSDRTMKLSIEAIQPATSLHRTIIISGFLSQCDNLQNKWEKLINSVGWHDILALRWKANKDGDFIFSTMFSAIATGVGIAIRYVFPPAMLLSFIHFKTNSFNKGVLDAEKAGKVLAKKLANMTFGNVPINLVGYGLGCHLLLK
jgi:hypothetical protein